MSEHAPLSEDLLIMLGAYVDGELTEDERATVEDMANKEPRIAEEQQSAMALAGRVAFDWRSPWRGWHVV